METVDFLSAWFDCKVLNAKFLRPKPNEQVSVICASVDDDIAWLESHFVQSVGARKGEGSLGHALVVEGLTIDASEVVKFTGQQSWCLPQT